MNSEINNGAREPNENKYLHIPDLVKRSYISNPKMVGSAEQANSELLNIIREDPYFDPVLFAISEIQKEILSSQPHKTKQWIDIMQKTISVGLDSHLDKNDPQRKLKFRKNPSTKQAVENIIKRNTDIENRHIFENKSTGQYKKFIDFIHSANEFILKDSIQLREDPSNISSERLGEMADKFHDSVKSLLESYAGEEFLNKFSTRSKEISSITEMTWKDAVNRMHYLPMREGQNIIVFSEESVPRLIGIDYLIMERVGSEQDWNIRVAYIPEDPIVPPVSLLLNQEGKINFHNHPPKHAALLNHIAVLVFHDLVIQEQNEKPLEKAEKIGIKKTNEGNSLDKNHNEKHKHLPRERTQVDKDLISDVYKITKFTPRRVELHKTTLPGAKEYKAVVDLYQEAIRTNTQIDMVGWIKEELENARKKTHKISLLKKEGVPAKFKLSKILDPITGEERYLETWVVEHTSPKPTEEELKSPLKLFERYYEKSSALASLDQMKPWFVGQ